MNKEYFTIEEKDEETWIVDNTTCHIDGEPFKYKQVNKCRATMLCEVLNNLKAKSINLQDIMEIIHSIKYSDWTLKDLLDYVYTGVSLDDLWARHDDLAKEIKEMGL